MRLTFRLLGLLNLANGLWMLLAPAAWYHHLPAAVPDTGPLNPHFVRDIGAAFTTIGVVLLVATPSRGVLLAATLFYALHALVHVADLAAGRLGAEHWLIDLPGVFLPAVVLGALCLPRWWKEAC
ncbi:MAG TPA: hypothetical protein VMR79_06645 [Verrucomicrobiae bacterium]|nr:hypothetical protein [Verrucomicrobiae bacterium]